MTDDDLARYDSDFIYATSSQSFWILKTFHIYFWGYIDVGEYEGDLRGNVTEEERRLRWNWSRPPIYQDSVLNKKS